MFTKFKKEDGKLSFFRPERKQKSIYADQLMCLIPLMIMATVKSGYRAGLICLSSVLTCIIIDWLCCHLTKKTYNPKDLSTIAAGLCIALMMPAGIDYGIVIFGSALAIGVKHIFGGKDNYIFNPTSVSLAFLIITFPNQIFSYPKLGETLPLFGSVTTSLSTGIESYIVKLGTSQSLSFIDVLTGNFLGAMGTTHVIVIIVCAICLMLRHSLSATITLTGLGTCFLISWMFPIYNNVLDTVLMELIGGYLLFGFIFLANDPQTTPKTIFGKILYGILLGISAMTFRHFGKVNGSFVFALLIANVVSIHIDSVAAMIIATAKKCYISLKRQLSSFERISESAKSGKMPNLADTQEIIIPPTNYNMPPVNNKVTKIKRKKGNILEKIIKKGDKEDN